mgnify:CR=1 FL=1
MVVYYFVIITTMSPEARDYEDEGNKIQKNPDNSNDTKKQETFAQKNNLDPKEQQVIDGLNLPKGAEVTSESINAAMGTRLDKET